MTDRKRVLIAVAPYYREIADGLLRGCRQRLEAEGVAMDVQEVPGALELPIAIRIASETGNYDGYVALGCVIRGETTHYETVANESARGLMELGLRHGLAIGNGILTVENGEQAEVRADPARKNKGGEAAAACLALMSMRRSAAATEQPRAPSFRPDDEHIIIADSGSDNGHSA